jgi:hypothetical protein
VLQWNVYVDLCYIHVAKETVNFTLYHIVLIIYWTVPYIALFTRALHCPLSWARRILAIKPKYLLKDSSWYYPPTYLYAFLHVSFILAFPPKSCMHFSSTPYTLAISSSMTSSFYLYLIKSKSYHNSHEKTFLYKSFLKLPL